MISDKNLTQEVSTLLIEANKLMNQSLVVAQDRCSPEEFETIRDSVGKAMAELLLEVLNPLYQQHLDLTPEGLWVLPKNQKS